MKILIVDDDTEIAEEVRSFLVRRGFEVVVACGVQAATAQLAAGQWSAVVTDMNMPGGNGLDVIRAAKRAAVVPLTILMTGQTSNEGIAEAEELGVHAILSKPTSLSSILAALEPVRRAALVSRAA